MAKSVGIIYLGLLEDPKKSLKHLSEVEKLGEEILVDRQEIVALDKRRNHNREALRALKNGAGSKTWMAVGSLLIKLPQEQASKALEKDQMHLDVEINKLRSNLKVKVNALQDMEHKDPIPGLTLQPMTHKEMRTIKSAMGISS
ncbi:hypothetical protein R5R35_011746 [Gryllus longicercus]|uniref:P53 and DNA damage-regulated protein 1 n=1 Tax=Gryllus longicercus TaxID=2509291 RepID=A0AAN9YXP1_9ORTH